MKKLNAKRLAALAMTLVMLLGVLTACGDKADTNNGSGDGEGFPTMTIQIAHVNPTTDDDQYNKLATLFAEKVTAATDGAVTFEICGNSELGGEADVLTGFDLGTHQMGIITNGSDGNLYGPSLVVELPFIREVIMMRIGRDGITTNVSVTIISTRSKRPPAKPESRPTKTPTTVPRNATMRPMTSELWIASISSHTTS